MRLHKLQMKLTLLLSWDWEQRHTCHRAHMPQSTHMPEPDRTRCVSRLYNGGCPSKVGTFELSVKVDRVYYSAFTFCDRLRVVTVACNVVAAQHAQHA